MINPFQAFWQKLCKQERGFALIEVVAATFIAGTVVVGSVVLLGTAARSASDAGGNLEFQQLVQSQIELIQNAPFIEFPEVPPVGTLGPSDTYPTLAEETAELESIIVEAGGTTVNYKLFIADADVLLEPQINMSFFISDSGTNYRYPDPDGRFETNVVQRIDVSSFANDSDGKPDPGSGIEMSFFKISVP